MTLVETTIAVTLLAVTIGLLVPAVTHGVGTMARQEARSDANDQSRLALAQVERDVRSGNVIASPEAVGTDAGMDVRLYTQANGSYRCVQYRVDGGELRRRTRPAGEGGSWPETWRSVASGVLNAQSVPPVPAFTRSADGQTLVLALLLEARNGSGDPVRVETSVTGRNATHFETSFGQALCD